MMLYKKIGLIVLITIVFFSCTPTEKYKVELSDLPYSTIFNTYGPPKRDMAFTQTPLNINGQHFDKGLGLNAPAQLSINLNKNAISFECWVGIDTAKHFYHSEEALDSNIRKRRMTFPADYVYDNKVDHNDFTKGGTAIFKVLVDGKEKYNSGLITATDNARHVKISLKNAKNITLIADPRSDGSFTDFVDIVDGFIHIKDSTENLEIHYQKTEIHVNHVGFHPKAPKTCYIHGFEDTEFELIDSSTQAIVYSGKMMYTQGELGDYLVGNFSEYSTPGKYYLKIGSYRTNPFRIDDMVLKDCLRGHMHFVSQQRSGHPTIGWNPNQHLDDGVRDDNGMFKDVTGGWYDACDVRKPVNTNATLLYAIMHLALDKPDFIPQEALVDEIKWGNKFLLAMQEPDGHLLSSLAFGEYKTSDNKWTDNIPGNEDDRKIQTEPERIKGHLYFVNAQLLVSNYFKNIDSEYSKKCLDAGTKALEWVLQEDNYRTISEYSLLTLAACELYISTEDQKYKVLANKGVNLILSNKEHHDELPMTLFGKTGRRGWSTGNTEHIVKALQAYANTFPNDKLTIECLESAQNYAQNFFIQLANRNAFNLMPWHVSKDSSHSSKQIGEYYYRNFLHVGLNRNISLKGYNLLLSTNNTKCNEAISIAQKQIDWIFGANPFNASYIIGFGFNQPALFEAGNDAYMPPHTPEIYGGTMTGICADDQDNPTLYPGWWWSTEYWIPTTAAIILLENELNRIYGK